MNWCELVDTLVDGFGLASYSLCIRTMVGAAPAAHVQEQRAADLTATLGLVGISMVQPRHTRSDGHGVLRATVTSKNLTKFEPRQSCLTQFPQPEPLPSICTTALVSGLFRFSLS